MLFNSLHFLVFFPAVFIIYYLLKPAHRNYLLLGASFYFYMVWKAEYALIIAVETIVNYFAALSIEKETSQKRKKILLAVCLFFNLGILFVFKYMNFFNESVQGLLDAFNIFYAYPQFKLLLPIGISFYTFQITGYIIDVYRKKIPPEKSIMQLSLFIVFFPQLVAGPIERAGHLMNQFREEHKFSVSNLTEGLKMMLWGFFKKLVIADRLAVLVNTVYASPQDYSGIGLMIATVFFAFQIYCDFSGYSDIAVGSARILGFTLVNNFKTPYFSKSISEFWKRWHISLSGWFREYLYVSLGGNRVPKWRWYFNLFFTFLVSGLWHGANWTYIIWGALNGFYLIFSIITKAPREAAEKAVFSDRNPGIYRLYRVAVTFILTCLAWVFFRASNVQDAFYIIGSMFGGSDTLIFLKILGSSSKQEFIANYYRIRDYIETLGLSRIEFVIAAASVIFMETVHFLLRRGESLEMLNKQHMIVRWGIYLVLALSILNLSMGQEEPFIYFQF